MMSRVRKILFMLIITVLSVAFVFGIFAQPKQNFGTGDGSPALISLDGHDATVKNAKQTITGQLKDAADIIKVSYEVYAEADQGELSFQGEATVKNNTFALENLMLKPGDNTIAVTALTADDKKESQTIAVTYDSDSIKDIPLKNVAKTAVGSDLKYANNNLLVFFEENTDEVKRQTIIDTVGGKCVGYVNGINMWQVEVEPDTFEGLQKTAERLSAMDDVFYADCNMVGAAAPMVTPTDPWNSASWSELNPLGANWSVEAVQALKAWDYQSYFSNIKVGIVDAGVQNDHEDLAGKVYFPDSQSAGDNDPTDNHGTHVAGIMGAIPNNNKGVTGILWNTTIYAYNWDILLGTDAHLMAGLSKTVQAGAKVVNFSLGLGDDISYLGPPETNTKVKSYANLSKAYMKPLLDAGYDFVVVQSAGNGQGGYSQDAVYNGYFCSVTYTNMTGVSTEMVNKINERIIVVGSAYRVGPLNFTQSSTSNAGSQVDICAPGVDVYSCKAGNSYGLMSGTSMAAPVVAGVAALAWSVNPTLTGSQVRSMVLSNTSYTVQDNTSSNHPLVNTYPMVNAKLAVEAAIASLPPPIAAKTSSTTVIDEDNYIYGLVPGISQSEFENAYIELIGNISLEYTMLNGSFGTGTIVDVINNDTQTIIDSYRIVIYGDVNVDANIDSMDAGLMIDFENYLVEYDAATGAALLKAANLNGDGNIDSIDAGTVVDAENFLVTIDQATGLS